MNSVCCITKAWQLTGIASGIGCSIGDTDTTNTTGIGPIPIPSTGIGLSLESIHAYRITWTICVYAFVCLFMSWYGFAVSVNWWHCRQVIFVQLLIICHTLTVFSLMLIIIANMRCHYKCHALFLMVVLWLSGNTLDVVSINLLILRRARLILEWVIVCGWVNYLGM